MGLLVLQWIQKSIWCQRIWIDHHLDGGYGQLRKRERERDRERRSRFNFHKKFLRKGKIESDRLDKSSRSEEGIRNSIIDTESQDS